MHDHGSGCRLASTMVCIGRVAELVDVGRLIAGRLIAEQVDVDALGAARRSHPGSGQLRRAKGRKVVVAHGLRLEPKWLRIRQMARTIQNRLYTISTGGRITATTTQTVK
jgi:hypothetical protein